MSQQNWFPISKATPGAGALLLRAGPGPNDPAYVGLQRDDGAWFCGDARVTPTHFAIIPLFDADDEVSS
jgi:hypothetical protein